MRCSLCYQDVIAARLHSMDKARKYMFVYAVYLPHTHEHYHLYLFLYLPVYVENHVFTPTSPSPVQLHKVCPDFHPFYVCNSSDITFSIFYLFYAAVSIHPVYLDRLRCSGSSRPRLTSCSHMSLWCSHGLLHTSLLHSSPCSDLPPCSGPPWLSSSPVMDVYLVILHLKVLGLNCSVREGEEEDLNLKEVGRPWRKTLSK